MDPCRQVVPVLALAGLLLPSLFLAPTLSAQDEVLNVERREDLRGRDRLVALLQRSPAQLTGKALDPRDLGSYLGIVTGSKIPFLYTRRKAARDAIPPFELTLTKVSAYALMSVVADSTDLRFVYRNGMVLMMPRDQVKPFTYLQIYDLRGPTTPIPNFPGPKIGLRIGDDVLFPEEERESGTTVSGFRAEDLEDLIQAHVTPDTWGDGRVSLSNANGMFLIRHTPDGHRQVQKLLVQLGVIAPPLVVRARRPLLARRRWR